MGAIEIEPASHFDAAAPGAARRPDADDAADEYPLVSLPIPAGGVAIYDTRLRHRGGANRAGKRRAVFYVTVVGAGALPVGLPRDRTGRCRLLRSYARRRRRLSLRQGRGLRTACDVR